MPAVPRQDSKRVDCRKLDEFVVDKDDLRLYLFPLPLYSLPIPP